MPLAQFHPEQVLEFHDLIISKWGGRPGVLSLPGLESALARPFHGYHNTLPAQAAALLHGLLKNHPFVDGNKRTATLTTLVALEESGIQVIGSRQYRNIDVMVEAVAANTKSETDLKVYFQRRMRQRTPEYPGSGGWPTQK